LVTRISNIGSSFRKQIFGRYIGFPRREGVTGGLEIGEGKLGFIGIYMR
jgi:hypothetical protein